VELSGRNVELQIGVIAVEGLGRLDEHALAAAVHDELVRIVGARGLPEGLRARAGTLRVPALNVPREANGAALGAAVGRAIYGALAR
jgi:hypothetical protein